jgi:hypothetical protein
MSTFTHLRPAPGSGRIAGEEDTLDRMPGVIAVDFPPGDAPRHLDPTGTVGAVGTADRGDVGAVARHRAPDGPVSAPARAQLTLADRARTAARWLTTALACALVLFALNAPNQAGLFSVAAFARIPVEGLLAVAVILVLPLREGRVLAALGGFGLGVLTIVKILDIAVYGTLARPFDLVLDWALFEPAADFLTDSIGSGGTIAVGIGAGLLALAVLALMPFAVIRITGLLVRHRTASTRAVGAVVVACAILTATGVQVLPDVPVASLAYNRWLDVRAGLADQEKFAAESKIDAFRDTPNDQLLNALRGKDVVFAFIESYGRDAVEDPEFASEVGTVLDAGTARLGAAGYASSSGWLTSPTAGGYSWLAHATLLSGLWIDNQQRYRNLVSGDRFTLTNAFHRASWQTVGVMPRLTDTWPEKAFYEFERIYDFRNLGYQGPSFSFATMPDQYTMSFFQRTEMAKAERGPVMAEIELISSHAPWAPLPRLVDWDAVGDGSIFNPQPGEGLQPNDVWGEPAKVRTEYRRSVEYTLQTLIEYIEKYGDDDLVFVFLGDHQPAPIITGENASRDVPITIVSRDRGVQERVAAWGWQDGLKPGPQTPVWPMNSFRDRFLTTFAK